jgi:hypothetical protein
MDAAAAKTEKEGFTIAIVVDAATPKHKSPVPMHPKPAAQVATGPKLFNIHVDPVVDTAKLIQARSVYKIPMSWVAMPAPSRSKAEKKAWKAESPMLNKKETTQTEATPVHIRRPKGQLTSSSTSASSSNSSASLLLFEEASSSVVFFFFVFLGLTSCTMDPTNKAAPNEAAADAPITNAKDPEALTISEVVGKKMRMTSYKIPPNMGPTMKAMVDAASRNAK